MGGGVWVRRTTSATLSGAVGALPAGRVLSDKIPSTPASAKRSCQRQTVVFDFCVAAMIAFVPSPSALKRMIRARQTCFCGVFRLDTMATSRRCCAAETVKEMPVLMPQTRMPAAEKEFH